MYEQFKRQVRGNPLDLAHGDGLWGELEDGTPLKLNEDTEIAPLNFTIRPDDVRSGPYYGIFGRPNTDAAAGQVLDYAQQRGGWQNFTAAEVGMDDYNLNLGWLVISGFLRKNEQDYSFTVGLVKEFYRAYPATRKALHC